MTDSVDPAIPTYRSSFGGLWPDLSHAPFLIRGEMGYPLDSGDPKM